MYKMKDAKETIDINIPTNNIRRKEPSICFHASNIFLSLNILKRFISKEFMELISCLYTPKIKAKVPPEIPGITSAIPIIIPLINKETLLRRVFMKLLLLTSEQTKHPLASLQYTRLY